MRRQDVLNCSNHHCCDVNELELWEQRRNARLELATSWRMRGERVERKRRRGVVIEEGEEERM